MKRNGLFNKLYMGIILFAVILIGFGIWIILRPNHLSEEEKQVIRESIENQEVNKYRDYMDDGKRLSYAYEDGITVIELLVEENDLEHAVLLIENGYDLSLLQDDHIDVISNLILYNKDHNNDEINQIIRQLVSQIPSKLNNEDQSGFSTVFNAIEAENETILNDLLSYDEVDINKRYKGLTPLLFACKSSYSDSDMIQSLIDHGASLQDQDELGNNCLFYAVMEQNKELVEYLIQLDDIDLNHQNQKNQTALHIAVSNASFDIATILVEHDLDLTLKDTYGDTAFQSAFKYSVISDDYLISLLDLLDQMVAKNAPVNSVNNQGYNSLFYAIAQNNSELVDYLIQNTLIDVNLQDQDGNTALVFAIRYDRTALALTLLDYNADPAIENNNGVSALELAQDNGMTEVINKIGQN